MDENIYIDATYTLKCSCGGKCEFNGTTGEAVGNTQTSESKLYAHKCTNCGCILYTKNVYPLSVLVVNTEPRISGEYIDFAAIKKG